MPTEMSLSEADRHCHPSSASPQNSLIGKVVAVTGASRGLGRAFAHALVREGAKVVLLARPSEALNKVSAELPTAMCQPCDVSAPDSVRAAFKAISDRFGKLDSLVNNAALLRPTPFEDITDAHLIREAHTNFLGPALTIREAIPLLRAAGGGDIVNITSDSVAVYSPHLTFYAATKGALEQLSIGLRQELRPEKIRVTILRSGPVADSELHRGWAMEDRVKFYEDLKASGAMEKFGVAVKPEVMAETLVHLLSMPAGAVVDHITLRPL